VFHALAAVAILGVAAVLTAPRRYTTLRFEDDPVDTTGTDSTATSTEPGRTEG
jgi:hypothetical protein